MTWATWAVVFIQAATASVCFAVYIAYDLRAALAVAFTAALWAIILAIP